MAQQYSDEERARIFNEYAEALDKGIPISEALARQMKDAVVGIKDYTENLNNSLKQLGKSSIQFMRDLNDGAQGAKTFNNVLSKSADVADKWGAKFGQVGQLIAGAYDAATAVARAAAEQADTVYEMNQKLSRTGTLGAGGMTEVFSNMQKFGFTVGTLEDMNSLLSENSGMLARFADGAYDGTQRIADMSASIMNSPLREELMNMGMSIKDINSGMAGYLKQQTAMGVSQTMTNTQLAQGAKDYLREMEDLQRVTGQTRDQMEAQRAAAQQIDVFMATVTSMNKLNPGSGERLYNTYNRLMGIDPSGTLARAMASSVNGLASNDKDAKALWQLTKGESVKWGLELKQGKITEAEYVDRVTKAIDKNSATILKMAESGSDTADVYGKIAMITTASGVGKQDYVAVSKDVKKEAEKTAAGADKATSDQTKLRIQQLVQTQGFNAMLNEGVMPLQTTLAAAMKMLSWIPGMPSRAAIEEAGAAVAGAAGAPGAVAGKPPAVPSTSTPSGPNPISKIVDYGPGWLEVVRPDGKTEKLMGARNWRDNNPGNLEYGSFAKAHGAIGSDGRFAIFPDYDTGAKAKETLIFDGSGYRNLTLSQAIARYAPESENNTAMYQRTVLAAVGGQDKMMSSYSESDRGAIMKAMERVEGYKVGTVTPVGYKTGGIASGPTSGYQTTLHGTEAIVPLPNGESIPVEITDETSALREQAVMILSQDVARMSEMLTAMERRLSTTKKTVQRMAQ